MATKPFFPDYYNTNEIKPKSKSSSLPRKKGIRGKNSGLLSLDCISCGLDKTCQSPKMPPHGKNKLNIAVVAEAPGKDEDEQGIPLVGKSGQLLRQRLDRFGIDLDRDCIKLNIVQCRPPNNRTPTSDEILSCRPRVEKLLTKIKPDLIFAFGGPAVAEILRDAPFTPTATNMHGRVIPSYLWNCWVCCGFHPAWYLRGNLNHIGRMDDCIEAGLGKALSDKPFVDSRLSPDNYEIVEDVGEIRRRLKELESHKPEIGFDYETNSLTPFDSKSKFLLASFASGEESGWCIPLEHPQARWNKQDLTTIYDLLRSWLTSDCPKVIQNLQFELLWSRVKLGVGINNVVCDTMVREHVLDNRKGVCGQEFQEYVRYGETSHKGSVDKIRLEQEYLDTVARYGVLDVRYMIKWKLDQDKQMDPDLTRAYNLFHEAIPLMTECKIRGIKVNTDKLDSLGTDVSDELDKMQAAHGADCVALYKQKYGKKWGPSSGQAKQRLFFGILKLKPLKLTNKGKDLSIPEHCSTDAESMASLLEQTEEGSEGWLLIQECLSRAHLDKLQGYIKNFQALKDDKGYLHPSFMLHTVDSYRSSSADPNFQNIPIRIPRLAVLRTALVPRFDWLMEMDFSGAEVRGYAVHSRDKNLIANIRNNVDYHRRYAAILFNKPEEKITKTERYNGKNSFIFPEFYGSNYETIARGKPEWPKLRVKAAEKELWDTHPDLKKWQKEMELFYHKHGFLQYLTGFRAYFGKHGCLTYNQICNLPNQGFAFHRLLKCLIEIEKEMRRRKMKSILIGQIHDSGVFDIFDKEVEEIVELSSIIVGRAQWEFDGIVPWEAEFKLGKNLLEMEKI